MHPYRLFVCRLAFLGLALASAASAGIHLVLLPKHDPGQRGRGGSLLPGQWCKLESLGPQGPRRCTWTVVEGRGLLTPSADGTRAAFTAPAVEATTIFHVRATDAEHPEEVAYETLQVVPRTTLVASPETVFAGASCTIVARQGRDGVIGHWRLLEPDSGELSNSGPARMTSYHAPIVDFPATFRIRFSPFRATQYNYAWLPIQVLPRVRFKVERDGCPCGEVPGGSPCRITAALAAAPQGDSKPAPDWSWQVEPEGAGQLTAHSQDGWCEFTPAPTASPHTVRVRATIRTRRRETGVVEIRVLPRHMALYDWEDGPPASASPFPGSMTFAPVATLFAGNPPGAIPDDAPDDGDRFREPLVHVHAMVCPEAGRCLLGGPSGLWEVARRGEAVRLSDRPVTALAVSPAATTEPSKPARVVYAEQTGNHGQVLSLEADGSSRLLAGSGRGPTFGELTGLAIDKDQVIYVADQAAQGCLHRIAPDGQVDLLKLRFPAPASGSGAGPAAGPPEHRLTGLVADAEGTCLYAAEGASILRITLDGAVFELLGANRRPGYEDAASRLTGTPSLGKPQGLQCQGGNLYLAYPGRNAICVFHLASRSLWTLAGAPSQDRPRLGPLRLYSPWLPLSGCAALHAPQAIALDGRGSLLVAQETGVFQLDLGPLAEREAAPAAWPR